LHWRGVGGGRGLGRGDGGGISSVGVEGSASKGEMEV